MSFRCLSSEAQEMIRLFAYMDARSIARSIIKRAADRKFLHIPQEVKPLHPDTIVQAEVLQGIFCPSGEWKSFEFDGMIGECLKYSLLRLATAGGEKFYSMHPLVQTYLQTIPEPVRGHSSSRLTVRLLASSITCGYLLYEFFEINRLLGSHVKLVHLEEITEPGDHYGFGWIFCELGNTLSIDHLERCVQMWKSSGDRDEEGVSKATMLLATGYHLLGRTQEALPLQEGVLESQKRLLGPVHLDTLSAMAHLANSYSSVGREQEALPLKEEVLESRKRLLGPDHLDTLSAMANLANSYSSVGREQEALLLQEKVLESRKRLLGPDHLDTLSAMANLASSYSLVGREQEALPLKEEVLESRKRLLGPDHLDTLSAMANLACSYSSVGREQEALLLEKEVLENRKRLLGSDHRHTLLTMYNLLFTLRALAMENELRTLAEVALPLHEKVHGFEHEYTVWIRGLLN
ncbi:hypothetical protein FRC19_011279 [Serendipita sp. 401]|nr:hypothetical protein FRC19_011279 [Serendipita sp. 401]